MSDLLFVTWDGGGNLPPAVAIASELKRRGHSVRFIGHETQRSALADAGLDLTAYAGARSFDATRPSSLPRLISLFTHPQMGRDVLADLAQRPADLVVVDCLLLQVLRACADSGQRYASLEHLFDGYLRGPWLHGPIGFTAAVRRLGARQSWAAAATQLVATLPSLDPGHRRVHTGEVLFSGPTIEPPAPHDLSAHDPCVLISLSTYAYAGMGAALQRILDATAGMDARVVVTTGPVIEPADLRAAANHEVHRFVPHDELMPHMSVVIGHGGHNTTMRALAHDLPLLVVPMHPLLDQPMVGRAVAEAGAGRVAGKRTPASKLRPLVEGLLADGPHRAAAARLGAEIRALDGIRAGADRLELLATADGALAR